MSTLNDQGMRCSVGQAQQHLLAYSISRFAVLQAHEAMDALKDNLREEHVIVYDYLTSFHQAG